eukprot:scaffold17.g561.t1
MRFWRTEMAQTAAGDKFDKGYGYNIPTTMARRATARLHPYSCMRIIPTTPGVGQARGAGQDGNGAARVHGCPYKTFAPDSLRTALQRLQVAPAKVDEAVAKARGGHFQLACAAAWEGKHGCACEIGINHPNQARATILLLTVLWPTLHQRSYLRWRTAALAFLRVLLISLPFNFSTEAFDAQAPGPVVGRLAALGNCFHYFIATNQGKAHLDSIGLLTSPVLDAATAGVHEAFSLLALPVVPPAGSFIPETAYARRVAGLLLAWSLLGWLLPVLLLLPVRDTRRRHAGGSGGGDASDGPRATAAAKTALGVEERVRRWLGVLIRPGREAPSPEPKLLTCAMHWWAVLLLTWIACCTAAPLFAPPPGAAGA